MPEARVLPTDPIESLDDYVTAGGGEAVATARRRGPEAVLEEIARSGLGGRGGAGFPAARKWQAVVANRSESLRSTVVVNAAEGEPGSFKDRAILRTNPFGVLEGALVAAMTIGADEIVVGTKRTFTREIAILERAIDAVAQSGWAEGIDLRVHAGPREYLYGEETALLEVIDGRYPFPRIAPPYRRGVEEVVDAPADVTSESSSAAHVELAGPTDATVAPPTLASNVETFVNAALIVARGADWFRSVGTEGSPGTIVCTVSGRTQRAGVGEFAMGTPLNDVIEMLGGGPIDGHSFAAAMSGVSNALVPVELFNTPVSHEAMRAIGCGLGTGGFIIFDDTTDFAAVAAGVAWFLAVESCGQCPRCKDDGLIIADVLRRIAGSVPNADDFEILDARLASVADGARCNLATQQQVVVGSALDLYESAFEDHARGRVAPVDPEFIAAIDDLGDGDASLDEHQRTMQPDWSHDEVYSGKWPADRLDDHREHLDIDGSD
jgi:NADH:ubiquinone oxidoreductase subunit F (NADH-binding)